MKIMTIHSNIDFLAGLARNEDVELIALDASYSITAYPPLPPNAQYVAFDTTAKISWQAIRRLRQLLQEHRPDVLHTFSSRSLANARLALVGLAGAPHLVSYRGIASRASRLDPANHLTYLSSRIDRHACESQACADGLVRSGIKANKCEVIYNCVNTHYFSTPGRAALAEFGIPEDAFVIGTLAAMRPVKGIDFLIEAANRCKDLKDVYCLLVGHVRDRKVERMLADTQKNCRIIATGFRADAVALASGFDLFIMPSRSEGLCRALLEAMGQGVCPVVSDAGGMKEVARDGCEGRVFPRGDTKALEAIIREMYKSRDVVKTYAAAARNRILTEFSPERMAQRSLQLYSNL